MEVEELLANLELFFFRTAYMGQMSGISSDFEEWVKTAKTVFKKFQDLTIPNFKLY